MNSEFIKRLESINASKDIMSMNEEVQSKASSISDNQKLKLLCDNILSIYCDDDIELFQIIDNIINSKTIEDTIYYINYLKYRKIIMNGDFSKKKL